PAARGPLSWTTRATRPLPVPVSPCSSRVGTRGLPTVSKVARWRIWARKVAIAGEVPSSRAVGWGAEGPSEVPIGFSPLCTEVARRHTVGPRVWADGKHTDDRCARASAQRLQGLARPQRWGTLFLVGLLEASTILCLQYRSGGEDKYTRVLSIVLAGSTDVTMGRRQMGLKTGQGVLVELPGCFDAQSERPTWPRGSLRERGRRVPSV